MGFALVVAAILVVANGFFVGAEFAIARLRPTQVEEYVREGRPGARSAQHAVVHIDAYLSACQLGITLASLGLGAVGEPAFHDLIEPVFGDGAKIASVGLATFVAFSVITTLHVVLGELAPKSAAISRTGPVALALAPPMRAFYFMTKPLVDLFNGMGNLVLKPFGIPPASEAGSQPHTEDELRALLRDASEQGTIEHQEQQITDRALVFGDVRAREVMQPRTDVDHVATTAIASEAAQVAVATGRTRLPVCVPDDGLESATGVVNAKDLLKLVLDGRGDEPVAEVVRPLAHASESARIDEVLRDMRLRRVHVALVHDEHGTVIGLVTMEDIIEEIVGEIDDEFDAEREATVREVDGRVIADGGAPVRDLAEHFGIQLGPHHESTVGGFVAEHVGRLPRVGEIVDVEPLEHRFEILGVEEAWITELAIAGPLWERDEDDRDDSD